MCFGSETKQKPLKNVLLILLTSLNSIVWHGHFVRGLQLASFQEYDLDSKRFLNANLYWNACDCSNFSSFFSLLLSLIAFSSNTLPQPFLVIILNDDVVMNLFYFHYFSFLKLSFFFACFFVFLNHTFSLFSQVMYRDVKNNNISSQINYFIDF